MATEVLRLADIERGPLENLLEHIGLTLSVVPPGQPIPGSFWGDDEAGLRGARLYARGDTPLHSVLHETSHYLCMDGARRARLDTDAGSDDAEENAVCYLQVLLADRLQCPGRERLFRDMDAWGYSFRLGSTRAWFESDAGEAVDWLRTRRLIDRNGSPSLLPRR